LFQFFNRDFTHFKVSVYLKNTKAYRLYRGFIIKNYNIWLILVFLLGSTLLDAGVIEYQFDKSRKSMVKTIEREVKETHKYLGKEKLSKETIYAMGNVKRHKFVPLLNRISAYDNRPLPIGYGQTISQPYIVAIMTDMLNLKHTDKVLEIGTGSGYQAAILAEIVQKVYTIEVISELGVAAANRLERLGYNNVKTKIADGYYGWSENGPYDAIIVTAAATNIPPPLLKQLKPGGKMIIPVKSLYYVQHLILISKDQKGSITTHQILPVRFVPLTGGH
jgi:protein-L-isoaspartate(D-aspartate) O-methyltransferase